MKPGDVLALGGNNHLDLHIPYYAALFNGMPIAGVDPLFKYSKYFDGVIVYKVESLSCKGCGKDNYGMIIPRVYAAASVNIIQLPSCITCLQSGRYQYLPDEHDVNEHLRTYNALGKK